MTLILGKRELDLAALLAGFRMNVERLREQPKKPELPEDDE